VPETVGHSTQLALLVVRGLLDSGNPEVNRCTHGPSHGWRRGIEALLVQNQIDAECVKFGEKAAEEPQAAQWKPTLSNNSIGTLINTSFGWRVAILPPFSGRPIVQIQARTRQSVGACIKNQTSIVKKLRWRPFGPLRAGASRLVSGACIKNQTSIVSGSTESGTGSSNPRVSPLRCLCDAGGEKGPGRNSIRRVLRGSTPPPLAPEVNRNYPEDRAVHQKEARPSGQGEEGPRFPQVPQFGTGLLVARERL
jgi:hypothetical protein